MSPSPALPKMLGTRTQLAFVVSDLEAAVAYWTECMGVGPFVVIEKSVGDRRVVYRGRDTAMDYSLGFSYLGDTQIELIWQFNDAPSPYKDFLDGGREGLHHIAFWPADFEAACVELQKSGFKEVCTMYLSDGARNVAYYDTPGLLGAMVEIVPMTPARSAYFGRIKKLVDAWDGSRPLRRFASREAFLASGEGAD
jgi:catechol 2,3-dioxygenase-like lactoylglutathione lyase family enzyme